MWSSMNANTHAFAHTRSRSSTDENDGNFIIHCFPNGFRVIRQWLFCQWANDVEWPCLAWPQQERSTRAHIDRFVLVYIIDKYDRLWTTSVVAEVSFRHCFLDTILWRAGAIEVEWMKWNSIRRKRTWALSRAFLLFFFLWEFTQNWFVTSVINWQ